MVQFPRGLHFHEGGEAVRVLLVEDDAELGSGVAASLKREHYAVDWVTDGNSAATALTTGTYDLVILDLGLPKLSGLQIGRAHV